MKVKLDIECTPAEARAFFGLPDVAPLQERVMKEVEQRVMQGIGAMDPAEMMKTWMPATMQGFDQMQRVWAQMAAGAGEAEAFAPRRVEKPWGHEEIWALTGRYCGKILVIETGKRLSLQLHEQKDEWIRVLTGRLRLLLEDETGTDRVLERGPGDGVHGPGGRLHRDEASERAQRGINAVQQFRPRRVAGVDGQAHPAMGRQDGAGGHGDRA